MLTGDTRMKKMCKICFQVMVLLILSSCGGQQDMIIFRNIQFPPFLTGIVKTMTFNIRVDTIFDVSNRWKNRKQLVFDILKDNAADVIGLQEARNGQFQQIQQALPQYAAYSAGRSDGKQRGESCPIFYRKDRFELVDSDTFWFSDTPFKPGSKDWGNLLPRICSWVHLVEKDKDTGFYVYNLHLDNLSQNSRKKSVQLLAKQVAARKTKDPFIVMGDFNMKLDNPAMMYLQKIGYRSPYPKMIDSWLSVNPGRSWIGTRHNFKGRLSGPKIDHISISKNSKALEVKIDRRNVDGQYPSDHFPVVAKILL